MAISLKKFIYLLKKYFNKMKLKAIIFDMDGVLIDSMKYHISSWKTAFENFNIFPKDEELGLLEGMSYKETINTISNKYSVTLSEPEKKKLYSDKKKIFDETAKISIYPDVQKILVFLKKHRISLALVTGVNKELVLKMIKDYFPDFFKIVVSGSDVKHGKPNPESYSLTLSRLQLNPEEVLVIENGPLGIESSTKAGLTTFALETTLNRKYLKKADKIFSSHNELFTYIKTLI